MRIWTCGCKNMRSMPNKNQNRHCACRKQETALGRRFFIQKGEVFMTKLRGLNRYQKWLLALSALMAVVFFVVYTVTIRRVGFSYMDTILVPQTENGTVTYAGKLNGQPAAFTVTADKQVTFQYGEKQYGPYTAHEDPAAVPAKEDLPEGMFPADMTGLELRCGEEILFRGGAIDLGDGFLLYDPEEGYSDFGVTIVVDGVLTDEMGNPIDTMEPSAYTLLTLMQGPELTHKGVWSGWWLGTLVCLVNLPLMLFADHLFRWRLAWNIRDADRAEPSDWEIGSRYVLWTLIPVMGLVYFVMGLQ